MFPVKSSFFDFSCPTYLASVQTLCSIKLETAEPQAQQVQWNSSLFPSLLAAMWIGMAQVAIGVTSEFICPLPGQFSPNCLRKETFDIQQCQIQASFLVHTSRENNMGQACFPDSRDSGMRVYHLNKRTNYSMTSRTLPCTLQPYISICDLEREDASKENCISPQTNWLLPPQLKAWACAQYSNTKHPS